MAAAGSSSSPRANSPQGPAKKQRTDSAPIDPPPPPPLPSFAYKPNSADGPPGALPLPHPFMDGDTSGINPYCQILQASHAVVTVENVQYASDNSYITQYSTGFILMSEDDYCLIFAYSFREYKDASYFIYFDGQSEKNNAKLLFSKNEQFIVLIVKTVERHATVTFSNDSTGYDLAFTVGAMAGIKLPPTIPDSLVGLLGKYPGEVTTPMFYSLDDNDKPELESRKYFQFICSFKDSIVTLMTIDDEEHTVNELLSAPVFNFKGEVIGIIISPGSWLDTKTCLFANHVIKYINSLCNNMIEEVDKTQDWQVRLKKSVEMISTN